MYRIPGCRGPDFNPRPPRGERRFYNPLDYASHLISIHALREESDGSRCSGRREGWNFNPRPPRGERRGGPDHEENDHSISIHALREESDSGDAARGQKEGISIHALREESDSRRAPPVPVCCYFNPRPPRGERPPQRPHTGRSSVFQSTPSARRATQPRRRDHGDRLISIHALREESDKLAEESSLNLLWISIHALREESDLSPAAGREFAAYFNPRPPRGERREGAKMVTIQSQFQSTPSARRATVR